MVLDRALGQEPAFAHLEGRLGATIPGVTVQRVDHINDTGSSVEVRFQLPKGIRCRDVASRGHPTHVSSPPSRPTTPPRPAATARRAAVWCDRTPRPRLTGVQPRRPGRTAADGLDELVERGELQTRIDRKYVLGRELPVALGPIRARLAALDIEGRRRSPTAPPTSTPRPWTPSTSPGAAGAAGSRCGRGSTATATPGLRGQDQRRCAHREDQARGPARTGRRADRPRSRLRWGRARGAQHRPRRRASTRPGAAHPLPPQHPAPGERRQPGHRGPGAQPVPPGRPVDDLRSRRR